ncbi:MAG TPA: hypothetical protein VLE27_10005 [Thermoanaerobaculia bacterium]|nr:hypothetical protein [Thermoanaerobaculia bacterium]
MSQETTYAGMIGEWQKLIATLEANTADLPYAEVPRNELAAMIARVQGISLEQAALTATKQEKSKQIKDVMIEGQRLATTLRNLVRQRYGIRSEKLVEFDLQPFRGRKRKAQPEVETKAKQTPDAGQTADLDA